MRRSVKKVDKGAGRMPWLSEARKDVTSCEKPRVGANNRQIRGCPNGATRRAEGPSHAVGHGRTQGTETSKYLQEKRTNVIP